MYTRPTHARDPIISRLFRIPSKITLFATYTLRGPFRFYELRADKWRSRRHLEELNDEHLADIGVSRKAANAEASKPFWMD